MTQGDQAGGMCPDGKVSICQTAPVVHLGAAPALGRGFTSAGMTPSSAGTVVRLLASAIRQRPVLSRSLIQDVAPRQIIGVTPASFRFLDHRPALLLPLRLNRNKTFLGGFSFRGLARLKPGSTLTQANADVARMLPIAIHDFPPFPGMTGKVRVIPACIF